MRLIAGVIIIGMGMAATHVEAQAAADPSSSKSQRSFERAIITYQYSGDIQGREVLYIDGHHMTRIQHTTSEVSPHENHQDNLKQVYKDGYQSLIDYDTGTGTRVPLTVEQIEQIDSVFFGLPMRKLKDGYIRDEDLLGMSCAVYEVRDLDYTKVHLWNGIPLRVEFQNAPFLSYTMEAVEVQLDVPISPEVFEVEEGIQVHKPAWATE